MYESHWQLTEKPFENTADPRFYYPCESHQAALLKLRYAIENGRGAALLAGASGLGKTLLVGMLRAVLGERHTPFVHLVFPQMPPEQLLAYLADELEGTSPGGCAPDVHGSVRRIERLLDAAGQAGRHAVVAIDEAHLLTDSRSLEALRLLLNFEHEGRPGLALLLVGQPGILPVLDRTPQLEERLAVKSLLRPFAPAETAAYVAHRLRVAGTSRDLFDAEALTVLHELAHGLPRRINRLADLALLVGYAEEQETVTAAQIEAVAHELASVVPE